MCLLVIHHCGWVLTQPRWCDRSTDFGQLLKRTLPHNSRSSVTYVIAVTVNCSSCTPDYGRGECPKHVEWSCNKTKIVLLYIVGYLYTYVEKDARKHETTIYIYIYIYIYSSLTFWLRDASTSLTFSNRTFCPHCIYVLCKQRLVPLTA
jgi:hypothetical protein